MSRWRTSLVSLCARLSVLLPDSWRWPAARLGARRRIPRLPRPNGTSSRERGPQPAAGTRCVSVPIGGPPSRVSRARCSWPDPGVPASDSARRRSCSTTAPPAWSAVRSGPMSTATRPTANCAAKARRPATGSRAPSSAGPDATRAPRAPTGSRGDSCSSRRTGPCRAVRWASAAGCASARRRPRPSGRSRAAMIEPRPARQARTALRAGARHLVRAGSGGAHRTGLAPVRDLRRVDRRGAGGRVPAPHVHDAGGGGRGDDRHALAGEGLRRLRQRERAAGGDRLSRRAGGREIGSRPAHQPVHGQPLRPVVAGARIQHRAHGRRDRAGVPEQHRARRRAVPDRAVGGAGIRLAARRPRGPPAGRLPDVLRDGEPRGLVRALDDGHVRQPDRHPDRAGVRTGNRLRQMAPRRLGAGADRDPAAAQGRRADLPARRGRDAGCPGRRTQGARGAGTADPRRADHRGGVRADGRPAGSSPTR